MPIDDLIGLPSVPPSDVYSQPTHIRPQPITTRHTHLADGMISGGPSGSGLNGIHLPAAPPTTTTVTRPQLSGLPIPIARGPSSQAHRQASQSYSSSSTTPNTTSPVSSLQSPFPFSPTTSTHPTTGAPTNGLAHGAGPSSYLTQLTTPPSSTSPLLQIGIGDAVTPSAFAHQLSYPSVPPPSLSSSLGSPVYSRRNSFGHANRRTSMDRGTARVAETGTLRNRRASVAGGGMPLTSETVIESPPASPPLSSSVVRSNE